MRVCFKYTMSCEGRGVCPGRLRVSGRVATWTSGLQEEEASGSAYLTD